MLRNCRGLTLWLDAPDETVDVIVQLICPHLETEEIDENNLSMHSLLVGTPIAWRRWNGSKFRK